MKSATAMLLNKTLREIWHRGEEYVAKGLVKILQADEKTVLAQAQGTRAYEVHIKFAPRGISPKCSCPYFTKNGHICKHIVAVAIVWDKKKGISKPGSEAVKRGSVPPPKLSSKDIRNLFRNPLQANLDQVRILAEETALGGYVRPHSKLPELPKIESDTNQSLSLNEMKKSFTEIKSWSRRRAYDPYFCSGEMIAAFCELLRIAKQRLDATSPLVAADILLDAQKFHYILVTQLIDDSQGLHEISEAHLDDIYESIKQANEAGENDSEFENLLQEFAKRRGRN